MALITALASAPLRSASPHVGIAISGGQQARVALARAIYAAPDVALLDDPLAALDPSLRSLVREEAIR